MNEQSIFVAALEKKSAAERNAFLNEACGQNDDLRSQVEALLAADAGAGSFLEHPPAGVDLPVNVTLTEAVGLSNASLPFLEPCDKPDRIGKLGAYEVIELVGQGGMGLVLRAMDTKLSRIVAVKVMAQELAANPTAVKRFLREAQSAAAVVHDHVVTIHAVDDQAQPPYLVMEYIQGQTLQQKIDREGTLQLPHILRIGSQMAAGLAAAHKTGVIHRDVKPANILLENGVERVKITDFGLARAADDFEMTRTGMIAGTPQYMSPEQADGAQVDFRSDLFSLGSVLYTMCTGRPAFRAESTMATLRRVTEGIPRSIREVNSEIPDWLDAVVVKLMAKNPLDRFQSAAEVAELLSQHLAHIQDPSQASRPAVGFSPAPPQAGAGGPDNIRPSSAPKRQPRLSRTAVSWGMIGLTCTAAMASVWLAMSWRPAVPVLPASATGRISSLNGWTLLFNGKDLTGWKRVSDQHGLWRVEDGILVGRYAGGAGYLFTERGDFKDFHLRVEARLNEEGNSGILFRSEADARVVLDKEGTLIPAGYEADMTLTASQPAQTGTLWRTASPLRVVNQSLIQPNEWFTMDVLAQAQHIVVKVNGEEVVSYSETDSQLFRQGHIGLQIAWPSGSKVEFRKIAIQELPMDR
jgi:serine/threonine protein kinase